jgi:hypothetical protein
MHVFASPIGRLLATRARTAALALVVVAAVGVAYASIPDSNGVIHGCYQKNNGQLRVIDPAVSSCNDSETALQWSQTGPQGPQGPTGPQGPEGPQGPAGPEGPSGSTAFGGFAEVNASASEGVPDVTGTIGTLQLPAGKYAIFAKVNFNFIENDSALDFVLCSLIAESDVDRGALGTQDGGEQPTGVLSFILLHEFAVDGVVEVACSDGGDDELFDHSDAAWSNLRITAIKLDSFQNGPLLQ